MPIVGGQESFAAVEERVTVRPSVVVTISSSPFDVMARTGIWAKCAHTLLKANPLYILLIPPGEHVSVAETIFSLAASRSRTHLPDVKGAHLQLKTRVPRERASL